MSAGELVDGLEEVRRELDELQPDPRNPKQHPDEQVRAIARSMEEHGMDQPIVAREQDGMIIKGEGRWRAAQMLGWDEVAVVLVDEDKLQALRRNLSDHGAAEASYLDERMLARLLTEATDEAEREPVAGFDEEFVQGLRMALRTDPEHDDTDAPPGDDAEPDDWEMRAKGLADQYAGSVVKQVVLIYDTEQYERVLAVLEDVMERTDATNHTEAAMELLRWWEERTDGEG